jgi:hypothetical protein
VAEDQGDSMASLDRPVRMCRVYLEPPAPQDRLERTARQAPGASKERMAPQAQRASKERQAHPAQRASKERQAPKALKALPG